MSQYQKPSLNLILKLYNRTEESFEEDIAVLREWLKTQPHLPEIMDDDRIKNFLILNKCSIEKTKIKIDNYYTLPGVIPDLFLDFECPEVKQMGDIAYWLMLPKVTNDLCRVQIMKIRRKELINDLQPLLFFARSVHLQEMRLKDDHMFKDICIIDMDGITWEYILKLTPSVLLKILKVYEDIYSSPIKAIYIINRLPTIDKILNILKMIMKPKIFERIHVYEDSKVLTTIFSTDILPKDYGGNEQSIEELYVLQEQMLSNHKSRFEKLKLMTVNEDLRPKKLENDELLGFYGNFKKLSVD